MSLRYAYNTNGIANHRLDDALDLIADTGYDGVAITLDHHHLDPYARDFDASLARFATRLRELGLGCVVETGARFLLNPRAKHEPTLVSPSAEGRARRVDFLHRALAVAAATGADAMSFWAGVPQADLDRERAHAWLVEGIASVATRARELGTIAALEPEPGMLVETIDDYRAIERAVPGLRLALDTGHVIVTGEREPANAVRETAADLATVSVEDMRRGEHVHLPFGEGDMDIASVLTALREIRYERLVCVELSRDAHRADVMVPRALQYLRAHEA
ncbi:MAG: sugar phosphate isomerase/epimerase [Vulcanimicrobiaceae bacterium]